MSWFPDEFTWILSCTLWFDSGEITEVRNLWGMNMSFKKEAFDLSGPFSTVIGAREPDAGSGWKKITAEEVELSLRVKRKTNKKLIYNNQMEVRQKVEKFKLATPWIARKSWLIGCERGILKRLYPIGNGNSSILATEHQLLRRILTKFFPDTFKLILRHPIIAWRRLSVAAIALPFVALGYCYYLLTPFNRKEKQLLAEITKNSGF